MVIAALVIFAALFVAWVLAPNGRPTERAVARGEEAVPVTA